jgi:hypothetical protein
MVVPGVKVQVIGTAAISVLLGKGMVPSVRIVALHVEEVTERLGVCGVGRYGGGLAGLVVPLVDGGQGSPGVGDRVFEDLGQGLGETVGEAVAEVVPDIDGEGTAGDHDPLTIHKVTGSTETLGIGGIAAPAFIDVDQTAVEIIVIGRGETVGL